MKSVDKYTVQEEVDDALYVDSFDGAITMRVFLSNHCDDQSILERCSEMAQAENDDDEMNLSLTFKFRSVLDSAIALYEGLDGRLDIEARPLIDCLKGELESMLARINGLEFQS